MIKEQEMTRLAAFMVHTHGIVALDYADCTIVELEHQGEFDRADNWRDLRCMLREMIDGRVNRDGQTIH